jgi:hypothetical protein
MGQLKTVTNGKGHKPRPYSTSKWDANYSIIFKKENKSESKNRDRAIGSQINN